MSGHIPLNTLYVDMVVNRPSYHFEMNKFVVINCWSDDSLSVSRLANGLDKASYRYVVELWAPCVHKGTYGSPYVSLGIYGHNLTI